MVKSGRIREGGELLYCVQITHHLNYESSSAHAQLLYIKLCKIPRPPALFLEMFKEDCYERYGWFAGMKLGQRIRDSCMQWEEGSC